MTSRLLAATKFSVPALPGRYVPRPRLHESLDAGVDVPLTVVVGVPGAGKSTVLRSWVRARPELKSIWLSCDSRDADPAVFWLALISALTLAWPDRWFDGNDLLSGKDVDFDQVATAVVNDLVDLEEPVVMVIDDFHFATMATPSVLTLLEHLPNGCRLVLGSRTEPQLHLHRFRAYAQVLEIRDAQLRLTPAEVASVMRAFELDLTETELELVTERTEGWMAGVLMAAVSLRDGSDSDRFLADLAKTSRAITEFLGSEVLDRQNPDVREYLLETSILDVLDPASCTAVTGRPDAAEVLRVLEERNLFLTKLDRDTYRYHHLFADLLRYRLRVSDGSRERALHLRAAAHFVEIDDLEKAIDHFLAAGEDAQAFRLLRANLVRAFHQTDGHMPRRLVEHVVAISPEVDPPQIPDLALALAASGSGGPAKTWLARAHARESELTDVDRARLAMAEGLVALQYGEADEIEQALGAYEEPSSFPDPQLAEFVPGILARSRQWRGDSKEARRLCEHGAGSFSGVSLTSELAWIACSEGGLTESEHFAHDALAQAELMGIKGHPVMVEAICALGLVAFERGDLPTAETQFEKALSISEDVRPALALISQLLLSRLWLSEGRIGQTLEGVMRARAFLPQDSTSPLLGHCEVLEALTAIAIGDLSRAERCVERLPPDRRAFVSSCRLEIARGAFGPAADALARCEPITLRDHVQEAILEARIACGAKADEADVLLSKALTLASGEGFVTAVTDDLGAVGSRVALSLRSRHIGDYEQAVLDRLENRPDVVRNQKPGASPLSDRELTVVRYLASRLTMREIAAEIFVSTNTLKTHVKRIYAKFGVSSRTEAVAEARRLGLL